MLSGRGLRLQNRIRCGARVRAWAALTLAMIALGGPLAGAVRAQIDPSVNTLSDDPAVLYSLRNRMEAGQTVIDFDIGGTDRTISLVNGPLQAGISTVIDGTCPGANIRVSRPGDTAFRLADGVLSMGNLTIDGDIETTGDAFLDVSYASLSDPSRVIVRGGTLQLLGQNTYAGDTVIEGGTLVAAGELSPSSAVVLSSCGKLDVTESPQTVRALTGDETSTVLVTASSLTVAGDLNTTYAGVIDGEGGRLVKAGSGTLTLDGDALLTGGTAVQNGTLAIGSYGVLVSEVTVGSGAALSLNGVIAGTVTVQAGGTLVGEGLIGGPMGPTGLGGGAPLAVESPALTNYGTVALLCPYGYAAMLVVEGDYANMAGGTLEMTLRGPSLCDNDLLVATEYEADVGQFVGGNVMVDGTLRVLKRGVLTQGQRFTVPLILAQRSITVAPTFKLDLPAVLAGSTFRVDPGVPEGDFACPQQTEGMTLSLTGIPSYTTLALGANQLAIATTLDQVASATPTDPLILGLDDLRGQAQLGDALDQLSPEFVDLYKGVVFNLAQSFVGPLERRFSRGPDGKPLSWSTPMTGGALSAMSGATLLGSPALPDAAGSPAPSRGSWAAVQGFQNFVHQETQASGSAVSRTGYRFRNYGARTGYDHRVDPHTNVGVSVAYGGTSGDFDRAAGRFDAHHFSVGPYVTYEKDGFFADGMVWYSRHDFETQRQVVIPGFASGDLTSSQKARSVSAYAGVGKMKRKGGLTFGPTLSLQYTTCDMGAFSESGALARLDVQDRDTHSFRSLLGGRLAREYKGKHGAVIPELRLRWAHEFADDDRAITAQFGGTPTGTFSVLAAGPQRDSAYVGAGVTGYLGNSAVGFVNYDAELGRSGYTAHNVNVGARFTF